MVDLIEEGRLYLKSYPDPDDFSWHVIVMAAWNGNEAVSCWLAQVPNPLKLGMEMEVQIVDNCKMTLTLFHALVAHSFILYHGDHRVC